MNSIQLNSSYHLYAFSDYRSMKSAMPYMQRVVLAKALMEVEGTDVSRYLSRSTGKGYRNYLEPIYSQQTGVSAIKSLITALQELYKRNGYSAKYILIERR